jgi:hypothetical protein
VQLICPGQRILFGKRVGKRQDRFLEQMEDRPLNRPPHWLRKASISCQESPPKRMSRSLTDSPGLRELTARQGKRGVARPRVRLHARLGHASPDLAPKPPDLSSQRVELDARDRYHLRRFRGRTQLPALITVTIESSSATTRVEGTRDSLRRQGVPVTCVVGRQSDCVPLKQAAASASDTCRLNGMDGSREFACAGRPAEDYC